MRRPKWLKRGGSVTFEELASWAKAHGAKNDRITAISIGGRMPHFLLVCEGYEIDDAHRPMLDGEDLTATELLDGDDVARWTSSQTLRFLP